MMVKVFQTNKNGKIEFTKKELETLLNEIYWQGRNDAHRSWTYTTTPTQVYTTPYTTSNQITPNYTTSTLENIIIPGFDKT